MFCWELISFLENLFGIKNKFILIYFIYFYNFIFLIKLINCFLSLYFYTIFLIFFSNSKFFLGKKLLINYIEITNEQVNLKNNIKKKYRLTTDKFFNNLYN